MAKAITLKQPWALLCVKGAKRIETRSWQTKYRGELLIHSSMKLSKGTYDLAFLAPHFRNHLNPVSSPLLTGMIIGKVTLTDIKTTEEILKAGISEEEKAFGDFSAGRYGWFLSNPMMFEVPISASGALSIWEYKETPAEQLRKLAKDQGNYIVMPQGADVEFHETSKREANHED